MDNYNEYLVKLTKQQLINRIYTLESDTNYIEDYEQESHYIKLDLTREELTRRIT